MFGIDWKHEARICAEDGRYGPAVSALAFAEPHLADRIAAIRAAAPSDAEAYRQALDLVTRDSSPGKRMEGAGSSGRA